MEGYCYGKEYIIEEEKDIQEELNEDNELVTEDDNESESAEESIDVEETVEEITKPQNDFKSTIKNILSWVWTIALAFIIAISNKFIYLSELVKCMEAQCIRH